MYRVNQRTNCGGIGTECIGRSLMEIPTLARNRDMWWQLVSFPAAQRPYDPHPAPGNRTNDDNDDDSHEFVNDKKKKTYKDSHILSVFQRYLYDADGSC